MSFCNIPAQYKNHKGVVFNEAHYAMCKWNKPELKTSSNSMIHWLQRYPFWVLSCQNIHLFTWNKLCWCYDLFHVTRTIIRLLNWNLICFHLSWGICQNLPKGLRFCILMESSVHNLSHFFERVSTESIHCLIRHCL